MWEKTWNCIPRRARRAQLNLWTKREVHSSESPTIRSQAKYLQRRPEEGNECPLFEKKIIRPIFVATRFLPITPNVWKPMIGEAKLSLDAIFFFHIYSRSYVSGQSYFLLSCMCYKEGFTIMADKIQTASSEQKLWKIVVRRWPQRRMLKNGESVKKKS